ncbi:neuronal acetylcholine receptor subunit alpha-3-like [Galendromus occidentalis]|uniref:Neuronal acetylcholine receptor subunit alpha-3-like n=1 Tax=Galendromus occidentalis TaxID=34638 RepID=A0AAJ7SJ96_9ACAR|nr:neuronal acetylcholine receptor subunit alpha-3-like [Galendromus occidentalis]
MSIFIAVIIGCLLIALCGDRGYCDEQEYRLTRYLMSNYDPAVRPSENASLPLSVKIQVLLQKIQQLEYETNTVKANWKVVQRWNDAHLRWNSSDFGGIAVLRIPSNQLWRPDVVLLNGNTADRRESHAVVHSSGEVVLLEERSLHSWCHFDKLHLFPFEVHLCKLSLASWAYDASQITMETPSFGVDGLLTRPSLEFVHELISSDPAPKIIITDTIARSTVNLELRLHRRSPLSQLMCLLLPVILANMLSIIAFFVPSNSGQKLTISTQSLIVLCIVLVYMHHAMPISSERVPLLVVYAGCSAVMVSLSILCSVLTLTLHSQSGCRLRPAAVPMTLKRVIRILAKLFVMDCCSVKASDSDKKEKNQLDTPKAPVEFTTDHIEHYNFSPSLRSHRKQFLFDGTAGIAADTSAGGLGSVATGVGDCGLGDLVGQTVSMVWQAPPLAKIGESVSSFDERLREELRRQDIREEWKTLSLLCDRVFLGVFFLGSAVTAALVLICSS